MKTLKTTCLKPLSPHAWLEPQSGGMFIARRFHQGRQLRRSEMCFSASPMNRLRRIIEAVRCYKYFVPTALNPIAVIALIVLLNPFQARAQESRPNANEQLPASAPAD